MSILVTPTRQAGVSGPVSLRKSWQPSCERRKSRARRTEEERAEAFFPLQATTAAADR